MTLPTAVSPQTTMAAVAPPRLWDGDDPARYDLLQSRVSGSLGPKDFLEEIWARDVVDLLDDDAGPVAVFVVDAPADEHDRITSLPASTVPRRRWLTKLRRVITADVASLRAERQERPRFLWDAR